MPENKENDSYLAPYKKAQKDYGNSFNVTLWASSISQQRRFQAFVNFLDMNSKRILDAGCSRGDFAGFLLDNGIEYERFIGVDGVEEVIEFAKTRKDLKRSEFVLEDFVLNPNVLERGNPHIVAISGTLNTMNIKQAKTVLQGGWEGCSETLIFNFLSDRCGEDAPGQKYPANRLSAIELLDWALDKTWAVRFFQDYYANGHDATIIMTKPNVAARRVL